MSEFIEKLKENKLVIVLFVLILVILFVTEFIVVYYLKYEIDNEKETEVVMEKDLSNVPVMENSTEKIFVEIKGEVLKPGIYELKSDKRIIDVIKLAEGLTKNADTRIINLSKKVEDEMVIIIYSKEQMTNILKVKEEENTLIDVCNKDSLTSNNACLEKTEATSNLISINKATKEELMTLFSIGEEKALNIIKYREEVAPFKTIEDLKKVTGIGDAIYDKIKDFITT